MTDTSIKRADNEKWLKFSEMLTLSLGAGLLLSGIIFFFAFNWEVLHRFTKMGVVLALLTATTVAAVKVPMRDWVRNITLFASCILVGAFLAVYGQVYQTGADSYLLFLTWTLCIVVWVAVADFYPLWIFFIGLVMLTCGLLPMFRITLVFYAVILALFTAFFEYAPRFIPYKSTAPKWFMILLFGTLYAIAVILLSALIMGEGNAFFLIAGLGISVWTYLYAIQKKNLLLYAIFCIGILIDVYVLMLRIIDNFEAMFLISFPFMAAVYFLGKHLIEKKKEWEAKKTENSVPENSTNE